MDTLDKGTEMLLYISACGISGLLAFILGSRPIAYVFYVFAFFFFVLILVKMEKKKKNKGD